MPLDWLKTLRASCVRRRGSSLGPISSLESRTLLSAVGSQFQVNTLTTFSQFHPAVAMDADGDFVVAWRTSVSSPDFDSQGVHAQRFNAAGEPLGGEFQVNTYVTSSSVMVVDEHSISIAMDADGDFVIAWQRTGEDGSGYGVYARKFNASGTPLGDEFQVNTFTTGGQKLPSVAMDADGGFVVAWESEGQDGNWKGIFARRYDSSANPLSGEFQVNVVSTGSQESPDVAMDAAGNFVITWQNNDLFGSNDGIFARRFDSSGSGIGNEFLVSTSTSTVQFDPSIGMDATGNFVITWTGNQVLARRFDSSGTPLGAEFQVTSSTSGVQNYSDISMNADGDFAITFQWGGDAEHDGSSAGVYARRFSSSGVPVGEEFQVNTYTTGLQWQSSIAMDSDGDLIVCWTSPTDGFQEAVYGQRFRDSHSDAVGVWRSGKFYLDSNHSDSWSGPIDDTLNSFGISTDTPLVGDWNGDGYDDIGVWRAGTFYLDANGNGSWDGPVVDQKFVFGNSTDRPIVGDWNNDGKDEIGVWRDAKFYLDLNGNRQWDGAVIDTVFSFGAVTDTPVIGDWNGDGIDDVGIRRNNLFYLDFNGNRVWNSGVDEVFAFGNSSDTPVTGDWNGDGIDDVGIWRAGKFYLDATPDHQWNSNTDQVISFGAISDLPLIGYWRSPVASGNSDSAPSPLPMETNSSPMGTNPSLGDSSSSPATSRINLENLASLLAPPRRKTET